MISLPTVGRQGFHGWHVALYSTASDISTNGGDTLCHSRLAIPLTCAAGAGLPAHGRAWLARAGHVDRCSLDGQLRWSKALTGTNVPHLPLHS